MSGHNYIVATIKPWNIQNYNETQPKLPGNWTLISDKNDLHYASIKTLNPRFIFFPHWSWIVPDEIIENFECVCFHMTDVPYGRGGSPLQNLIVRGHETSMLTALKMSAEVDAGPIYKKMPVDLSGTANDILKRVSELIWTTIPEIVADEPTPTPQLGPVTHFKRRRPEDGNLNACKTITDIYNYIRMLDGEGYPPAFLETETAIFKFTHAILKNDAIEATVKIKVKV